MMIIKNIADEFKNLKAVMLGRGLIRNPGLCGALKRRAGYDSLQGCIKGIS